MFPAMRRGRKFMRHIVLRRAALGTIAILAIVLLVQTQGSMDGQADNTFAE
jgi:hypothetical protein